MANLKKLVENLIIDAVEETADRLDWERAYSEYISDQLPAALGEITVPELTYIFRQTKAEHHLYEQSLDKPNEAWQAWYAQSVTAKLKAAHESDHLGISPLQNWGVVDHNRKVYRSAQPHYKYEFKWLKEFAKIGVIINLRSEAPEADRAKANLFDIDYLQILVKDHYPPADWQADFFCNVIRDEKRPILFHCRHGRGRTSTFSVLAKMTLGWTLEDAIKDEEDRFRYPFNHKIQREFLENYENTNT